VAKAGQEDGVFVAEFGLEAGFIYARDAFDIVNAGVGVAARPEKRQSLFDHGLAAELFWAPHAFIFL